jgi:response regulator RpfG family c-di-GMP phosphodiesterase
VSEAENVDTGTGGPLLLLVEDDAEFREFIANLLRTKGYEVRECANGLIAKTVFDLNHDKIQIVLSDIMMPELNGVELLRHIRTVSNVPVVLMTGFFEALEAHTPAQLGAKFIPKPFKLDRLLGMLAKELAPEAEPSSPPEATEESAEPDLNRYCPIHIDQFLTASKLLSDIYIRLGDDKYIMVAHRGDEVDIDRFKVYREKKVDFLYVTFADFSAYLDFSVKLTSTAAKLTKISREKKARLLKYTTELMVEKCFLDHVDPSIAAPAQRMVEDILSLATENRDVLDLFAHLDTLSNRTYSHSVAVAVFSCMVAHRQGWTSATTMSRLALAGLLIDVGLREIDPTILAKRRVERSLAETKQLESHPARSRDIILGLRGMPEDVAVIVYQHHETPAGTGYPLQIREPEFHRLGKLVASVERFVELIIPVETGVLPMSVDDALRKLRVIARESVDQPVITVLIEIFKLTEVIDGSKH